LKILLKLANLQVYRPNQNGRVIKKKKKTGKGRRKEEKRNGERKQKKDSNY
jgi:hypothetical protein